eukprot:GILI01006514.1.p1 GENE.GILI01006514.1~~GILI01006514.1.p1  ORF type:complete len:524 (-),score=191.31 GILI01006514.1:222-1793(-)
MMEDYATRSAKANPNNSSKSGFDAIQDDLRRNKDQLSTLRRENKELKNALQASSRDANNQSKRNMTVVEADILQTKIHSLRRTHDDLKNQNKVIAKEIERMSQQQGELEQEGRPILQEKGPLAQKIRALENRLDKSLIKHNEAVSIKRTYETILKRLQEERVGFDNQLAAIEKTLKVKEHDFQELKNMAKDAEHSKEMARAELKEFTEAAMLERHQKTKHLEERKSYVTAKLEQTQRQEKLLKQRKIQEEEAAAAARALPDENEKSKQNANAINDIHTEEETRRMLEYAESYRKIKEFTRAANKDEVINKWHELDENTDLFRQRKQSAQAHIEQLLSQRVELRRRLEEMKYSGTAQVGSRRIIDEFETHLDVARNSLKKDLEECDSTNKLVASVRAGVVHLANNLSFFEPEDKPTVDDTIGILTHSDQKIRRLIEEILSNGDEEALAVAEKQLDAVNEVVLPEHNTRIRPPTVEIDREDRNARSDAEDGEEDPHSREDLKQMAISAVERETKKAKKRKAGGDK